MKRSYEPLGGIYIDHSIKTTSFNDKSVTENGLGQYIYSDGQYTYIILREHILPTIVTGVATVCDMPREVMFYMDIGDHIAMDTVLRIECSRALEVSPDKSTFMVTEGLNITVQESDGSVTYINAPDLNSMFKRSKMVEVPHNDGQSYNVKVNYHSSLDAHCVGRGDFPGVSACKKGITTTVSDGHFTSWGCSSGTKKVDRIVYSMLPMIHAHYARQVVHYEESICSMDQEIRIREACNDCSCMECNAKNVYSHFIRDYYRFIGSHLKDMMVSRFKRDLMTAWAFKLADISEAHPCVCADCPIPPSPMEDGSSTDPDMPELVPISKKHKHSSEAA